MAAARSAAIPGPEYRVDVDIRAPLPYVFDWCTDYQPDDARREGDEYERRVLARTPRHVTFEDLETDEHGWILSRVEVELRPPNRWHAERRGNRADLSVDYLLTEPEPGTTHFAMRVRRRALSPFALKLSKAEREKRWTEMWHRFGAALERDYRRDGAKPPGGAR